MRERGELIRVDLTCALVVSMMMMNTTMIVEVVQRVIGAVRCGCSCSIVSYRASVQAKVTPHQRCAKQALGLPFALLFWRFGLAVSRPGTQRKGRRFDSQLSLFSDSLFSRVFFLELQGGNGALLRCAVGYAATLLRR